MVVSLFTQSPRMASECRGRCIEVRIQKVRDHGYQQIRFLHHTNMGGTGQNGQPRLWQSVYITHFATAFSTEQAKRMLIPNPIGIANIHENRYFNVLYLLRPIIGFQVDTNDLFTKLGKSSASLP